MKLRTALLTSTLLLMSSVSAFADNYEIDSKGMHASINFKIQHLGYSWLTGRFNTFDGKLTYDADKPNSASIEVNIDTSSIDSNHAERDKHLRSDDFLDVSKYPKATFKSTSYQSTSATTGVMKGNLTLHGVTKPLQLQVTKIGEGKDPWGGYRVGFQATTSFDRTDFGVSKNLGPKSNKVDLDLHIEGVKK